MRQNHALAAAGGTSREVRKSSWFPVVLGDELFGERGDLSIGEIGEIEVCLLILNESEVESWMMTLVTRIGADHGESAHESWRISGGI